MTFDVPTCNNEWRGPRGDVAFPSANVQHFCAKIQGHPGVCWCSCGAYRGG